MPVIRRSLLLLTVSATCLLADCASHVGQVKQHVQAKSTLTRVCLAPLATPAAMPITVSMLANSPGATIPERIRIAGREQAAAGLEVYRRDYLEAMRQHLSDRGVEVSPCQGKGASNGAAEPQARLSTQIQRISVFYSPMGYKTDLHLVAMLHELPSRTLSWEAAIVTGSKSVFDGGLQASHVAALVDSVGKELQQAGWIASSNGPAKSAAPNRATP